MPVANAFEKFNIDDLLFILKKSFQLLIWKHWAGKGKPLFTYFLTDILKRALRNIRV